MSLIFLLSNGILDRSKESMPNIIMRLTQKIGKKKRPTPARFYDDLRLNKEKRIYIVRFFL